MRTAGACRFFIRSQYRDNALDDLLDTIISNGFIVDVKVVMLVVFAPRAPDDVLDLEAR